MHCGFSAFGDEVDLDNSLQKGQTILPELADTVEAKMDATDSDLRQLGLQIHGP